MSSGDYRSLGVFKDQFVEEIAKATEGMSEEQKASFMHGYEKGKKAGEEYENRWQSAQANKK